MAVQMHQIIWARWIEVSVEHELEARRAHLDIGAKPESDAILREFRASLVVVTAAAHTIESEPPAQPPAGINTGVERSKFNAITSGRAVDAAIGVLDLVASPPRPSSRWVERWATERAPYQAGIEQLRHDRDREPCRLVGDDPSECCQMGPSRRTLPVH